MGRWRERTRRGAGPTDLYLLLRPDVPWVEDPARDRGEQRDELHELFRKALAEFRVCFREISGCWTERRGRALARNLRGPR